MKINKVYINKEGAPMVSRNPWPDESQFRDETGIHFYEQNFKDCLDQAKRDAVPLDTSHEQTARSLRLPITTCDSFIEVDIDVEFVHQMANSSNGTGWFDVTEVHAKYSPGFPTRTIARVVLEKQDNDDLVSRLVQAQIGTPEQVDFIESYKKEYFQRFPSYYKKLTDLEWHHLYLDAYDAIEEHCTTDLKQQLAAAQERVKVLEESTQHDKEIDMITAPFPVRNKILNSFREAWSNRVRGTEPPDYTLSRVLDELGIK